MKEIELDDFVRVMNDLCRTLQTIVEGDVPLEKVEASLMVNGNRWTVKALPADEDHPESAVIIGETLLRQWDREVADKMTFGDQS